MYYLNGLGSGDCRVTYNASKTVYMIVSNKAECPEYPDLYLNRTKLKKVSSHKHLGVTSNMKWGVHIDAAISKANKRLNGVRRIRFLITREARIVLYKALILPVLEHANVLYDNCSIFLKQRLEGIQRQAAIMCTGAFVNTSYTKLLNELGWASLEERRKFFRLCYLYKMANKKVPKYLSDLMPLSVGERTNYNLRNVGNLSLIRTKHVKTYKELGHLWLAHIRNNARGWDVCILSTFCLRFLPYLWFALTDCNKISVYTYYLGQTGSTGTLIFGLSCF